MKIERARARQSWGATAYFAFWKEHEKGLQFRYCRGARSSVTRHGRPCRYPQAPVVSVNTVLGLIRDATETAASDPKPTLISARVRDCTVEPLHGFNRAASRPHIGRRNPHIAADTRCHRTSGTSSRHTRHTRSSRARCIRTYRSPGQSPRRSHSLDYPTRNNNRCHGLHWAGHDRPRRPACCGHRHRPACCGHRPAG